MEDFKNLFASRIFYYAVDLKYKSRKEENERKAERLLAVSELLSGIANTVADDEDNGAACENARYMLRELEEELTDGDCDMSELRPILSAYSFVDKVEKELAH